MSITLEERQKLYARREAVEREEKLKQCAYIYFLFKGLKGYERKSYIDLMHELSLSRGVIYNSIKKFEEYLNGLSEEERHKVLSADESGLE